MRQLYGCVKVWGALYPVKEDKKRPKGKEAH